MLGIELFFGKMIYGWDGSQLTSLRSLVLQRISFEGDARAPIVPEQLKMNGGGEQYYFTIVSIQKKFSLCLASQTKLQMSPLSLYTPTRMNLF